MIIQKHILIEGRVQGVGFRYTTQGLADIFGVKGWVRNLACGAVEILAQGDKAQIEGLMNGLSEKFESNIKNVVLQDSSVEECFENFNVRYDYK